LSHETGRAIDLTKDLIIFDEIQACPKALTSLKYFAEDAGNAYICAAGSLLGVNHSSESFPVGKVEFLDIFPMSFYEFLKASGEAPLLDEAIEKRAISKFTHSRLNSKLLEYLFVGGLPAAVKIFLDERDDPMRLRKTRDKQNELIDSYMNDIAKHSGKINSMHIKRVLENIPSQLARDNKKFIFKNVIPGKRAFSDLASPIDWLENAGIINKTMIVSRPEIPLSAYASNNSFKLFLFDTGILGALSDFAPMEILEFERNNLIYKGFFLENYIAQELRTISRKIYSWIADNYEIDFLVTM
jgi:hypothetical protein